MLSQSILIFFFYNLYESHNRETNKSTIDKEEINASHLFLDYKNNIMKLSF